MNLPAVPKSVKNLFADLSTDDKLVVIWDKLLELELEMVRMRSDLAVTFTDEFSPKRQELSKQLADKMTNRLKGEFLAREATAPTGAYWCKICDAPHPSNFICRSLP